MAISVKEEVVKVIAGYKNFDEDEIKQSDTLAELDFSKSDSRDLAQALNLHFYNNLKMTLDRLLHGRDIKPAHKVSKVVSTVISINPRPRNK